MAKVEKYECDKCGGIITVGWDLPSQLRAIHSGRTIISKGSYCTSCLIYLIDERGSKGPSCGDGCSGCDECRRGPAYR